MSPGLRTLARKIDDVVQSAPGNLGVSVRLPGRGQIVSIDADRQFPLGSVYKVPLLATTFHKVASGELSLDQRVTLREIDKSLGSSDLQYFRPGISLTTHDLCHLMIVHSDNTATDMVHRLVGMEAPNEYMHQLGLNSIDIYCPCREYFLIFLGWAKAFKGMSIGEIGKVWKTMSRDERVEMFRRIRIETRNKTVAEAQKLAMKRWGISDEKETKDDRDASEVMDNYGSPSDITRLLELILAGKIAPRDLTNQMINYMLLCDAREGLPAKIPEGVLVANKTGSVSGTVNDSAMIFASPKSTILCACFSTKVKHSDAKAMRCSIADIGLLAYEALK